VDDTVFIGGPEKRAIVIEEYDPAWAARFEQVKASLAEALLLATDFRGCARHGFGRAAELLQARARTSRTGGDCYGYVLVATGRAEIMLDPVMNLWDCAPLLPILEEAGGTFTDWNGVRTIDGGNSIATNRLLFDEVMSLVKNEDADYPGN